MDIILIALIVILVLYLRTFILNKDKFSTVNLVIGLPGSGKTTALAAFSHVFTRDRKLKKKGYKVYSNVAVKDAIPYDWKTEFGYYDMSNAMICLDEAGIYADNRSFKTNFTPESLEYLKLLRHRFDVLVAFSQTSDVDLKIRSMSGMIWICSKSVIPGVTVLNPVCRKIDVDEETHQIMDMYYLRHRIRQFFAAQRIFRPLYYSYFDSYEAPELPPLPPREPYNIPKKEPAFKSLLARFKARLTKQS